MAAFPPALSVQPVPGPLDAAVTVPGSKSITNRAFLLAALAAGTTTLTGVLDSDDTRYMAESLRRLGVAVAWDPATGTARIEGCGGRLPRLPDTRPVELFVGNAGTAARFLTALATLGQAQVRIDGVPRMRERPIEDLLRALRALGAQAEAELGTGAPPVRVQGTGLSGGEVFLPGNVSSQYLSALLLVAPYARRDVVLRVQGTLVSRPYVEMTVAMMRAFGVEVQTPDPTTFRVPAGQVYRAREYAVEPDASSASYFFAAAAVVGGRVRVQGLPRDSLQGDAAFPRVLQRMGCEVDYGDGYVEVRRGEHRSLRGVEADLFHMSDMVPTLAATALFAEGPTVIRNVANIRVKETDRIAALVTELSRLGAHCQEYPDGLSVLPSPQLHGAVLDPWDDHRLAMAFAVIGLRLPGVVIRQPGCVSKTFPEFFTTLAGLGAQVTEVALPEGV